MGEAGEERRRKERRRKEDAIWDGDTGSKIPSVAILFINFKKQNWLKSQWFLSNNKTFSLWESLDNVFNHE